MLYVQESGVIFERFVGRVLDNELSNDNCLYAPKAESGENRILEEFFFFFWGKLTCLN